MWRRSLVIGALVLVGLLALSGVAHGQPDGSAVQSAATPTPDTATATPPQKPTGEATPTPAPVPIPPAVTPEEIPTPEATETPVQHGGGGSPVNGLLEAVSKFLRSL